MIISLQFSRHQGCTGILRDSPGFSGILDQHSQRSRSSGANATDRRPTPVSPPPPPPPPPPPRKIKPCFVLSNQWEAGAEPGGDGGRSGNDRGGIGEDRGGSREG